MTLPVAVEYGQVKWKAVTAVADSSSDEDALPDAKPVKGSVTFVPSASVLLATGTTPPATIFGTPVTYNLASDGVLRDQQNRDLISLVATDSPGLTPTGWTWQAIFKLEGGLTRASFSFELPAGTVVDLTNVSPVGSSGGTPIIQGPAGEAGPPGSLYPLVISGDDETYARPDTELPVVWFAAVEPLNADDTKDITIPLGQDEGGFTVEASDASVAGLVADDTSATNAALRTALVRMVGPSNGTGDSTAINTALADVGTAGRGAVKLMPGQSYVIDAPVVLQSNTVLDLSGCALVRATGYVGNLLTNAAALPLRSVADAAMTAGSPALTSATAAFTSADVGRAVSVGGAGRPQTGPSYPQALYATITAVSNATTATLSVNAYTTVSAASLSVYGRDKNIGIVGDAATRIDAGDVQGWDYVNKFRRIDGLSIRGNGGVAHAYNGGGVVFWSVGDVDLFTWDDWIFTHPAGTTPGPAGVQACGPLSRAVITNARGTTQDDMVALQGSNWGWEEPDLVNNDVQGSISDVYIGNVFGRDCRSSLVKIFGGLTNAGVDTKLRGIVVEGLRGDTVLYGITVESDRAGVTDVDALTIRDVRVATSATGYPVEVRVGPLSGTVAVEGVDWVGAGGTSGAPRNMVQVAGGLKHLNLTRLAATAGDYINLVNFQGNSTNIHSVTVDDVYVASGTVGINNVHVGIAETVPANITNMRLSRLQNYGTGGKALVNLGAVTNLTMPRMVTPLLPTAVDGLTAWYRADAITGLSNGAAVTSWPDSSSAGNALTQAISANQPTYVASAQNGLPGVQFDGTNDVLVAAAGVKVGHVFVVAKYNAATFSGFAGLVTPSTVGPNPILNGKNGTAVFDSPFPGVTNSAAFYKDGDPYTDITLPGPMNHYALIEVATIGSSFTDPTTLMVGQDRALAGRYWNGVIVEIVVFRKRLSDNARQAIETYLATKWGTQAIVTL